MSATSRSRLVTAVAGPEHLPECERQEEERVEHALGEDHGDALQAPGEPLRHQGEPGVGEAAGRAGHETQDRGVHPSPERRGNQEDHQPAQGETDGHVDEALRRAAEEPRRQQRDPHRLHEEEERGDRHAGLADGDEVEQQRSGVERAHDQEPRPEGRDPAVPVRRRRRPNTAAIASDGDGEAKDEEHAGGRGRPGDQCAGQADEQERAATMA